MRILIADDSELIRKNLETMICKACVGCEIRQTSSVQATIRGLKGISPQVLILDLCFPDGTGFQILEHINNLADRGQIMKVFVLTNHPIRQNKLRCDQLGADGFFDKSHEFERLVEQVTHSCCPNNPDEERKT